MYWLHFVSASRTTQSGDDFASAALARQIYHGNSAAHPMLLFTSQAITFDVCCLRICCVITKYNAIVVTVIEAQSRNFLYS